MGIREPAVVALFFGLLLACAVLSVIVARSKVPPEPLILLAMVLSSASFAVAARFGSPLLLTPVALAVNASGYAIFVDRRFRPFVALIACAAFVMPLALELGGVLSPTFVFEGGGMVVVPTALDLPATPTIVMVVLAVVSAIVLSTLVVGHIRDRLGEAERRLMLYTWHLREFVPPEARRATDPRG
jgi:hypothetical protein